MVKKAEAQNKAPEQPIEDIVPAEAVEPAAVAEVTEVVEAVEGRVVEVVWSALNTDTARAAFRDDLEAHVAGGMLPALAGQGGGQHFVILVRPVPMSFPVVVDEGV